MEFLRRWAVALRDSYEVCNPKPLEQFPNYPQEMLLAEMVGGRSMASERSALPSVGSQCPCDLIKVFAKEPSQNN